MRGLYVHIPFCVSKCHYCDFYSLAGKTALLDSYLDALFVEADKYRGMQFDTLYIGGGTPSILGAKRLGVLIKGLSKQMDLGQLREASIEVNPDTAGRELFNAALSLGINRISLGVQSLNDEELRKAGRIHDARTAIDAADMAAACGFDNISADVIIGLPGQNGQTLLATLDQLRQMKMTHISTYCLSIEEHTVFATNPPADLLDDDSQAGLFESATQFLKQYGFKHYEISNFSLPGRECLHNLNYWRGGEYVGIGPAAASHINGKRFKNSACLEKYLADPLSIEIEEDELDEESKMAEEAMLRLRLLEEGLDLENLQRSYKHVNIGILRDRLDRLIEEHMLINCDGKYRLPSDRVLTSNQIFANVLN